MGMKQQEDNEESKSSNSLPDFHGLLPAHILEDQSSFLSKAFLIRYCEEEVEVNDIVQFRSELDVEPEYLNTEYYLELDLFFSDLASLGGPEKWQQNYTKYETEAEFKPVSS
jgi:hypothetical protein